MCVCVIKKPTGVGGHVGPPPLWAGGPTLPSYRLYLQYLFLQLNILLVLNCLQLVCGL